MSVPREQAGTPGAGAAVDAGSRAERRQALEDQREFLLRSLRDLDSELQAGDIGQHDYEALRSRYTARAAAVLRALAELDAPPPAGTAGGPGSDGCAEEGASRGDVAPGSGEPVRVGDPAPAVRTAGAPTDGSGGATGTARAGAAGPRARRRRRRALVGGAIACFAVAAVVLVVSELGVKLPGQPVTGSLTLTRAQQEQRLLDQAETALVESKPAVALVAYRQVLALDPSQPEALSESGWLEFAAGVRARDRSLVRSGQAAETKAVAEHPGAFAPRLYLGAMLAQEGDTNSAVAQFTAGLADHPPASTLSAFASTIVRVYGEAHVPVPSEVAAAAGSAGRSGSSGSGSSGSAG